jgi:hypothetical protein
MCGVVSREAGLGRRGTIVQPTWWSRAVALTGLLLVFAVGLGACATYQTTQVSEPTRAASAGTFVHVARRSHAPPSHATTSHALLAPLPEPDCTFKDTASGNGDAVRMKLDYERQCYRQSEMIARERLRQLQTSVEQGKQH